MTKFIIVGVVKKKSQLKKWLITVDINLVLWVSVKSVRQKEIN